MKLTNLKRKSLINNNSLFTINSDFVTEVFTNNIDQLKTKHKFVYNTTIEILTVLDDVEEVWCIYKDPDT